MSQRGSRRITAQQKNVSPWGNYIRSTFILSLSLTLASTFILSAQDTQSLVNSGKKVIICVDGASRQISTQKEDVRTLLHEEKITLNPYDMCEPSPATSITDGMTVKVTRVTFETIRERISIEPPIQTRWDRRMIMHPVVVREGRPGVAVQMHCIWKKDGVVSQQWVQNKRTLVRPLPKVVVRGKLASRAALTGRQVMTMEATAYDPGPGSCGRHHTGHTAIGLRAMKGVIAVDPRVIPLGTRVYVDGYGPAVAADTGSAIKGHRIDLCFSSRQEAMRWGRHTVNVVVLE